MLHLTLFPAVHGLFHAASIRPPRAHVAASAAAAEDLETLFEEHRARTAAAKPQTSWATAATKTALEGALAAGWQPKLRAHDIPVIELQGELTADALDRLLRHEAPRWCSTRSRTSGGTTGG